jgi:hypothetical protein
MSAQTKKILVGVVVALVAYHFYMQAQVKKAGKAGS